MTLPLIQFDYDGALLETGITQSQLDQLAPRLESVRDQMYPAGFA